MSKTFVIAVEGQPEEAMKFLAALQEHKVVYYPVKVEGRKRARMIPVLFAYLTDTEGVCKEHGDVAKKNDPDTAAKPVQCDDGDKRRRGIREPAVRPKTARGPARRTRPGPRST